MPAPHCLAARDSGQGWQALHRVASSSNLEIKPRGAGLVIGDRSAGRLHVKASDIDRSLSRSRQVPTEIQAGAGGGDCRQGSGGQGIARAASGASPPWMRYAETTFRIVESALMAIATLGMLAVMCVSTARRRRPIRHEGVHGTARTRRMPRWRCATRKGRGSMPRITGARRRSTWLPPLSSTSSTGRRDGAVRRALPIWPMPFPTRIRRQTRFGKRCGRTGISAPGRTQSSRVLMAPELEFEDGQPVMPHKHRLLMMLDESIAGAHAAARGRAPEMRRLRHQGISCPAAAKKPNLAMLAAAAITD